MFLETKEKMTSVEANRLPVLCYLAIHHWLNVYKFLNMVMPHQHSHLPLIQTSSHMPVSDRFPTQNEIYAVADWHVRCWCG